MRFSALSARRQGLLFGVCGILALSPDSLVLRLIHCDNIALISLRGIFLALAAALLLAVFPQARGRVCRGPLAAHSLIFAAGFCAFPLAIKHAPVANVLVIISAAPLLAAVGAHFFLAEKTPKATWATAIIVAFGVAIIFSGDIDGGGGAWGNLFALISALSLALNSIIVRGHQDCSFFPSLLFGGLLNAIIFAGFADWGTVSAADWAWGALNGGVITAASFFLIIAAAKRLPPAEVNLLFLLETILGPLWVWLALSEAPPATTWAAAALILPALAAHAAWSLRRGAGGDSV